MEEEDGKNIIMMNRKKFYKYYIPALIKAIDNNELFCEFHIKGPEHYYNFSEDLKKEIDKYIDTNSGKDDFLDNIGFYFDAKSHNFQEIQGINIDIYRRKIKKEIEFYKKKYNI